MRLFTPWREKWKLKPLSGTSFLWNCSNINCWNESAAQLFFSQRTLKKIWSLTSMKKKQEAAHPLNDTLIPSLTPHIPSNPNSNRLTLGLFNAAYWLCSLGHCCYLLHLTSLKKLIFLFREENTRFPQKQNSDIVRNCHWQRDIFWNSDAPVSWAASYPAAGWGSGGPGFWPARPSMRPSAQLTKGSLCGHRGAVGCNQKQPARPKQAPVSHWMSNKLVY